MEMDEVDEVEKHTRHENSVLKRGLAVWVGSGY
jgi:hypothetical protein